MMNGTDLASLFKTIRRPHIEGKYGAVPIPQFERHRLAVDHDGNPHLLLSVAEKPVAHGSPSIRLRHLFVIHDALCSIVSEGKPDEVSRFTVVGLLGDAELGQYFLRVASSILNIVGDAPTSKQVADAVERLIELFRRLGQPSNRTIQGLWAELFVIAIARDVEALVGAWHSRPSDRFDFNAGSQRIEVKSSSSRARVHHFRLEQVLVPPGSQAVVCSLFVERAGSGTSIADLIAEIRDLMPGRHDLMLKLEEVVADSLGESWGESVIERFDRRVADDSLEYYDASGIPSPDPDLPFGVSDVHFSADLGGLSPIDSESLRKRDGIIGAMRTRTVRK